VTAHSTDRMTPPHIVSDDTHSGRANNAIADTPCGHAGPDDTDPGSAEMAQKQNSAVTLVSPPTTRRRPRWKHHVVFVMLPLLAMACAVGAAYFRYLDQTAANTKVAQIEASTAAREATTAMFSYTPTTAQEALNGARERLTGEFRDQFTSLIDDYALPGAVQYKVSTQADVAAIAVVDADPTHVTLVLFVNQTATVGDQAPTSTAFTARTTVEKVDGRWLIAAFEPI
jgi:Mce-associated membrane protein